MSKPLSPVWTLPISWTPCRSVMQASASPVPGSLTRSGPALWCLPKFSRAVSLLLPRLRPGLCHISSVCWRRPSHSFHAGQADSNTLMTRMSPLRPSVLQLCFIFCKISGIISTCAINGSHLAPLTVSWTLLLNPSFVCVVKRPTRFSVTRLNWPVYVNSVQSSREALEDRADIVRRAAMLFAWRAAFRIMMRLTESHGVYLLIVRRRGWMVTRRAGSRRL